MFLKFVDALDIIKTAQMLCDLMDEIVQKLGEEHVQIVTNNALIICPLADLL